jgi:alpha-tubulin suppressor-like RCC1 family protein
VRVLSAVRDVRVTPEADSILVLDPIRASDVKRLSAAPVLYASARPGTPVGVRWASSQPQTAAVDAAGVVAAHGLGPATINVTAGPVTRSARIGVLPAVREVRLSAVPEFAVVGDTMRIRAVLVGRNGQTLTGIPIAWATSQTGVASVDADGGVRFDGATGVVRFSATAGFTSGMTGGSTNVVAQQYLSVDAGWDHTCATSTLGRVYCWGRRAEGQLGMSVRDTVCFDDGSGATDCSLVPKRADSTISSIKAVSAGSSFTCGIAATDRAYCWGANGVGQLGNGSVAGRVIPALVSSIPSFAQLSAGGQHGCAVTPARTLFCWGADQFGQLGTRGTNTYSTTPVAVNEGTAWAQVSAGNTHTCAATAAGQVYCWGNNASGQVDAGSPASTVDTAAAVPLPGGAAARLVSASWGRHSCALASDGAAYCWGSNGSGELGSGAASGGRQSPSAVAGGMTFSQLATGDGFTCGLSGGRAYCWGRNDAGQLGNTGTGRAAPQEVAAPVSLDPRTGAPSGDAGVTFASLSAGRRHACALTSDGRVYCWGSDVLGALGTEVQAAVQFRPVRVARPR